MYNYPTDKYIRRAIRLSDTLDARLERYIPLVKIKRHLMEYSITEKEFLTFMYRIADREYAEEVTERLYHAEELGKDERFKITSGIL